MENYSHCTGLTTLNKSALGYITIIYYLKTAVCKCVQSNEVLDQFIYTYQLYNFKCMLIELLQTGLTAYTQQECTYLAPVLHQPLATNKSTI